MRADCGIRRTAFRTTKAVTDRVNSYSKNQITMVKVKRITPLAHSLFMLMLDEV